MIDEAATQVDASVTPGNLLKAAREEQQISEREMADRLNWMPNYVAVIENDDYQSLRSPAFARGYVKAYGRLLQLDEERLLAAFDSLRSSGAVLQLQRIETRPLQVQSTGLGVAVGLAVLVLLVGALWWWQGGGNTGTAGDQQLAPEAPPVQQQGAADPAGLDNSEITPAGEE